MPLMFAYGTLVDDITRQAVLNKKVNAEKDQLKIEKSEAENKYNQLLLEHNNLKKKLKTLEKDTLKNFEKTPHKYFEIYPTIRKAEDKTVEGVVFPVTVMDLVSLDRYETHYYKKIKVNLESGKEALAYIENLA